MATATSETPTNRGPADLLGEDPRHAADDPEHHGGQREEELAPASTVMSSRPQPHEQVHDAGAEGHESHDGEAPGRRGVRQAQELESGLTEADRIGGIDRGLDDGEDSHSIADQQERGGQRRTPPLDRHRQPDVERRGREQVRRCILDQVDRAEDARVAPGALDDDGHRPQDQQQAQEAEDGRAGRAAGPREHKQAQPRGQDGGDAMRRDLEQVGQVAPSVRRAVTAPYAPSSACGNLSRGRSAISANWHRAFASRICSGVWPRTRRSAGAATTTATHRAREVATLRRLREYRKLMPRGASSGELEVIE